MAFTRIAEENSRSQSRQIALNQGMAPSQIRQHPNKCNCRTCRRRFNLPKNKYKSTYSQNTQVD